MSKMLISAQMEVEFEWRKWAKEIPSLKFKPSWGVQIIPPFAGAVVRFVVTKGEARVSVYLDCYDNLGFFGRPHWELYPSVDGNNIRFDMHDTESLLEEIAKSLKAGMRV